MKEVKMCLTVGLLKSQYKNNVEGVIMFFNYVFSMRRKSGPKEKKLIMKDFAIRSYFSEDNLRSKIPLMVWKGPVT